MSGISHDGRRVEISVVVPVHNEAGNIIPLLGEIENALSPSPPFEIIYVDDGSTDATATEVAQGRETCAALEAIVGS